MVLFYPLCYKLLEQLLSLLSTGTLCSIRASEDHSEFGYYGYASAFNLLSLEDDRPTHDETGLRLALIG
ncbi:MAG: hypothetical protein EAX81_08360 [Candidatus Thorarchaeota archaeon]|nr:hypothetical protein [Candidatus Thorarchaeota archaeon]